MSPFIVPSLKKIVGANLEKIDKVDFRDTHTYRQTDQSDLIGPSLAGVQKREENADILIQHNQGH